jgi:transcriptional regulator with XRE-family HTH domain
MFTVGDVVRKLRIDRDWTVEELAKRAVVNKMTVSGIERGENYTRRTMDAIAKAFGFRDASDIDARLHAWARLVAGPTELSDGEREWLAFYEVLRRDGESLQVTVAWLRRYVSELRARLESTGAAAAAPARGTPGSTGKPGRPRAR